MLEAACRCIERLIVPVAMLNRCVERLIACRRVYKITRVDIEAYMQSMMCLSRV